MIKIFFDDKYIDGKYYAGLERSCDLFNESFKVGVTLCDTYTLTLNNDYGIEIPNIVKFYEDDTLIKTLYVDSYKINDFTTDFELLDSMVDFNFNYDASPIIQASKTGKVTLLEILYDICSKAGIETDIESFNQSDLEVSYYDNSVMARTYIEYMAELDGSYAYITADNKLAFKPFKTINENKISFNEISYYKIGSKNKITRVLFDNGVEVYEAKATEDNGMTYYVNLDNVFCTSKEAVEVMLEKIGNQEFYNFNTNNCPINSEIGDIITFTDGVNDYPTIFQFNGKISMMGSQWFGGVNLEINNAKQEETKVVGNNTTMKAIKIKVDRNENKIKQLITDTSTINDNLTNNYYTITKTNELIQSSGEGITNTFSEAGGNNVFRNTGLWFEDISTSYYIFPSSNLFPSIDTFTNDKRAYEYWDGEVEKKSNSNASNQTSLLIKKGYLEQQQKVSNGNYTVSFKYKKLIELAVCKVTINNFEYELTSLEDKEFRTGEQNSDGEYITQPLQVQNGNIKVDFYSDTNDAIEIYDLMVNAGSVKLAYSQNQNETTTDTVNISKGITITSSNIDTIFRANADGIRTINKSNETLSEFTDKGMKNRQMEVTDEATIVQVLWQNVAGQTWLTRL